MGLFARMDRAAFWGFDVWSFSARSLFQAYGREFLLRAVLRRPLRVLAGLWRYRSVVRPARGVGIAPVGVQGWEDFERGLAPGQWLIGIGYCQRPMVPPCPSERFGHGCRFLDEPGVPAAEACVRCEIREIAGRAAAAGASLYLMTSAADIARDLLLPALNEGRWKRVLLLLCPYSVAPLSLAMSVCGIEGLILSYGQGDCRDYAMWLRADVGDKLELTRLPAATHRRLLKFLERVAASRSAGEAALQPLVRIGDVYAPGVTAVSSCRFEG